VVDIPIKEELKMKQRAIEAIVRTVLTTVMLSAVSVSTLAQTPEQRPPSNYAAVPPAGHEAFFKALGELMSKYPESAKRFAISDQQIRPTKPGDELRRRGQCPEGQGCGFYCWTSPVTFECCECNIRPK
jgi:hypothetical protein